MTTPLPSWDLVRVYGTWASFDSLRPGTYTVTIPARVTDATDDKIIPAGVFASGSLQTQVADSPSLDLMLPATDDPDIEQTGWYVLITVKFTDGSATENYAITVPYANRPVASGGNGLGVNLRTVALPIQLPSSDPAYKVGVPGGLAKLDDSGQVVDSDGNPISPTVTSDSITDATATGKALVKAADAAAARAAIGAGTSGFDGTYGALSGKPTLGTAAASDTTAFATAAQGAKADTAVQPAALPSAATDIAQGLVELATPTEATTGTDTQRAVTPAGLKAAINALVNGAPAALDTLKEIADQLATDETAASALTTTVSGKLAKASNLSDLASASTARTNLGLGNLDNTSDLNKPISTATQTALNGKANTGAAVAISQLPAGSVLKVTYTGGAWPARPTARTDVSVFYMALTVADPTPSDFIAGTDYIFKPTS